MSSTANPQGKKYHALLFFFSECQRKKTAFDGFFIHVILCVLPRGILQSYQQNKQNPGRLVSKPLNSILRCDTPFFMFCLVTYYLAPSRGCMHPACTRINCICPSGWLWVVVVVDQPFTQHQLAG